MKKLVFSMILLVGLLFTSNHAKAEAFNDGACKLYGTIQGVGYDAFKKACNERSSDVACQNLLNELEINLSLASSSREKYVETHVAGCKIIMQEVGNGISFLVEGTKDKMNSMKNLLNILLSKGVDATLEVNK